MSADRTGASPNVADQYGARLDQVVWRLRGCSPRKVNRELAEGLSPELQNALQPWLDEIESLSERIREY
jgi:hypothetical protein